MPVCYNALAIEVHRQKADKMTEIRNYFTELLSAYRRPVNPALKGVGTGGGEGVGVPPPSGRAVHDTVELSEGGQKIINLARGREVAAEIRAAPLDEDFAAKLLKAQEDIFRISRLFGATIRNAFLARRG